MKYCSENNKRLIHFSTCEVYGKTIGSYLPKDSPLRQVALSLSCSPFFLSFFLFFNVFNVFLGTIQICAFLDVCFMIKFSILHNSDGLIAFFCFWDLQSCVGGMALDCNT